MESVKSEEFIDGYMAGYWGREVKTSASQKWLDAYGRGYETAQIEDHYSEKRDREIAK